MYARMHTHLTTYAEDNTISPYIRNSVAAGLIKLDEYYKLAKQSHYTILATGTLWFDSDTGSSWRRRGCTDTVYSAASLYEGRVAQAKARGRIRGRCSNPV